jgi:hypothetical protein
MCVILCQVGQSTQDAGAALSSANHQGDSSLPHHSVQDKGTFGAKKSGKSNQLKPHVERETPMQATRIVRSVPARQMRVGDLDNAYPDPHAVNELGSGDLLVEAFNVDGSGDSTSLNLCIKSFSLKGQKCSEFSCPRIPAYRCIECVSPRRHVFTP